MFMRGPMPMLRMLTCAFGLVLVATCLNPQAATITQPVPATVLSPYPAHATQAAVQAPASTVQKSAADSQRALLKRYCVSCHNQKLKTGSLSLDEMDIARVGEHGEVWEKVVRKLRAGQMPPVGLPRPDRAAYDGLASWLEGELDGAAAARPNPGRAIVRRLNRFEYTNAVHDLLELEIDGRTLLPTDESGYGFDNIGDVLSFSPGLLERYMSAARKISRLAVGHAAVGPSIDSYKVSSYIVQEDRVSEGLPFGSRGGTVIRHNFPTDGEYVLSVRLGRRFDNDAIQGLENREDLDVRVDGVRITRFQVGGECAGSKEPRCIKPPGIVEVSEYERTADTPLQVRFRAKGGPRRIGVSFIQKVVTAPEGAGPDRLPTSELRGVEDALMSVDTVQIQGPFNPVGPPDTPSRQRIFSCRPAQAADEETCATRIIGKLARRAYRRPVTARDLQPLLGFYRTGRATGGFESGIQFALEGLLVSPDFLLRVEHDPPHAAPRSVNPIGDVDLASRLSFFLWSSLPDDELLDLAERGKLSNRSVLEQQVRRMLADRRASALVDNFASQWLYLRDLRVVAPDTQVFRDFDDSLRDAFQQETQLFLESQLREDRSVVDLLRADYTFVNERLARFYGIPNVYGTHFRRVKLTDPHRRGVLGHGSLLTVTSYPDRTSPVQRGKFVLDNLLGSPPPAPPPNVEGLKQTGAGGEPATVRARMEAHRKNAVCASCHAQMDPIGFALENFDAIGKWRSSESGAPIDSAGVLGDGTRFNGAAELGDALLRRQQEFVQTLVAKLMTYALGRGVEYYDRPAIRGIARNAAPTDYRWSSLILELIDSVPFRMRMTQAPEAEPLNRSSVGR